MLYEWCPQRAKFKISFSIISYTYDKIQLGKWSQKRSQRTRKEYQLGSCSRLVQTSLTDWCSKALQASISASVELRDHYQAVAK